MPDSEDEPQVFQDELARIEAAVDAGETDPSKLGFWKLVRQIKADAMLSAHWADQVGRIDRKLFEARVRPRFPVWFGNGVLTFGLLVGGGAIAYAVICDNPTVIGALLLASALILSASVHDLAHWAWGRIVGIGFLCYFLDGPTRIQPGLKTDYASYLRTGPTARATMHAAGAIASKIAPLIPLAFAPLANAPWWAIAGLLGFTALQIVTDLTFSVRRSDWARVRRELLVARAQEARRS
jgi:hypothetical protein